MAEWKGYERSHYYNTYGAETLEDVPQAQGMKKTSDAALLSLSCQLLKVVAAHQIMQCLPAVLVSNRHINSIGKSLFRVPGITRDYRSDLGRRIHSFLYSTWASMV
jgi:hypothetical protein